MADTALLTNQYGTQDQQPNSGMYTGKDFDSRYGAFQGLSNLKNYQVPDSYAQEAYNYWNPKLVEYNNYNNANAKFGRGQALASNYDYLGNHSEYKLGLDKLLSLGLDYKKLNLDYGNGGRGYFSYSLPNKGKIKDATLSYGAYPIQDLPPSAGNDPNWREVPGADQESASRWEAINPLTGEAYPNNGKFQYREGYNAYMPSRENTGFWNNLKDPAATAAFLSTVLYPEIGPYWAAALAGATSYASQGGPTAENDTQALINTGLSAATAGAAGYAGQTSSAYNAGTATAQDVQQANNIKNTLSTIKTGTNLYNNYTNSQNNDYGNHQTSQPAQTNAKQQMISFLVNAAQSGKWQNISPKFWDAYSKAFGDSKPTYEQVLAYSKKKGK